MSAQWRASWSLQSNEEFSNDGFCLATKRQTVVKFVAVVVVEVPRYMPIGVCASSMRRPKAIESASKAGMRRVTQRERRVTGGHVWETAAREAVCLLHWLALTGC